MKIDLLCNHPQFIHTVSKMIYHEFVITSASKMTFDQVENFFSNTHSTTFPMTFIAVINNQCIGTVSIFENDWKKYPQYVPWLASLYVNENDRNKKIGIQLIEAVIQHLRFLGYSEVYLKTENTSEYYIKLGWKLVKSKLDENRESIDLLKFSIH